MYICAMNDKEFKRKIKELGLYQAFFSGIEQSKHIDLTDEYIKLCKDLYEVGLLKEFLLIIADKKTGGLKAFRSVINGKFNHVKNWMMHAPAIGSIHYDGAYISYSEYMKIKGIER